MFFIILFILIFQMSSGYDKLINDLGNPDYQKREEAHRLLKKEGFLVLPKLRENFNNSDLEISLRCIALHNEYFYLTDSKGNIPNIWYLDEKIRFPLGHKVTINKEKRTCVLKCDKDVSLEYVEKLRPFIDKILPHEDYCTGDDCCYCYCFCDFCFYKSDDVGKLAMKYYIRDCLESGQDKEELRVIVENASKNSKKYILSYRLKSIEDEAWQSHGSPPGVMLK